MNPLKTSAESTFENAYHRRVAYPTGLNPAISIARRTRLLACARETSVSVWRILGRARVSSALEQDMRAADAMDVDGAVKAADAEEEKDGEECGYEKLLDMELDTTTNICASAISDDARWLAVSDAYEVKLFELIFSSSEDEGPLRPRRVKTFAALLTPHLGSVEGASALGFTPDGGRLVLAGARSGRVVVVDLTARTEAGKPDPRMLRSFEHHAKRTATSGRVVKSMPTRVSVGAESGDEEREGEDAEMGGVAEDDEESSDENDEEMHILVTRIAFSPDGQWLVTTDDNCRTYVFNLDSVQVCSLATALAVTIVLNISLQHHATLPTSPARVAALAFISSLSGASAPLLLLAHVDATIGVFDVESRRFPDWAGHLSQRSTLPQRWTGLHDGILGVAIEPPSTEDRPSAKAGVEHDCVGHAILWGSTWLCRVALNAPLGWGGFARKRRRGGGKNVPTAANIKGAAQAAGDEEDEMSNFRLVTRYRPLLCADFLSAGELLIVERPLVDVLQALPPAFFKPKYGT